MLFTIDFWNYLFIFTSKKGKNMKRDLTLGRGKKLLTGGARKRAGDMSPPVYMLRGPALNNYRGKELETT
jgi:hypothetical protein